MCVLPGALSGTLQFGIAGQQRRGFSALRAADGPCVRPASQITRPE